MRRLALFSPAPEHGISHSYFYFEIIQHEQFSIFFDLSKLVMTSKIFRSVVVQKLCLMVPDPTFQCVPDPDSDPVV
jgi:hypothetical protein